MKTDHQDVLRGSNRVLGWRLTGGLQAGIYSLRGACLSVENQSTGSAILLRLDANSGNCCLPIVYAYNSAISSIVAEKMEPYRSDFEQNEPVVENIPAFMQRLKEYSNSRPT